MVLYIPLFTFCKITLLIINHIKFLKINDYIGQNVVQSIQSYKIFNT